jgi:dUTP pyrophosphatase
MNINIGNLLNMYPRYMHLTVYVNPNNIDLYNRYYEAIYHHNSKLLNSIQNVDAGFDLYVPENQEIFGGQPNRINFGIKCSAKIIENGFPPYNSGYYLHPRSSISNGPLRLANSTGIIDSGYRGNIIGAFDCLSNSYYVHCNDRIVQICAPGLMPIYVELVDSENYLGGETMRGGGGFGSTGA